MTDAEFEILGRETLRNLRATNGAFHIPELMRELRTKLSDDDYALAEEHVEAACLAWRGMQVLGLLEP